MITSRNFVQEKLDNLCVLAAGIASAMPSQNYADSRPIAAHDVAFIANMAELLYEALEHKVLYNEKGEVGSV